MLARGWTQSNATLHTISSTYLVDPQDGVQSENDEQQDTVYADEEAIRHGLDVATQASSRWRQLVLERPYESLRHIDSLASSGFNSINVLILHNNSIENISSIIAVAPTLRMLHLANNLIAQLPTTDFWSRFQNLTLLFLNGNNLKSWQDIGGLIACPKLMWVTINDNPIMNLAQARSFLVNKFPSTLKMLNDHVVTDTEYMKSFGKTVRYKALSSHLNVGEQLYPPERFVRDGNGTTRALMAVLSYVKTTEREISCIYARNSPSIAIQRIVRGHQTRCNPSTHLFNNLRVYVVRLQKLIRGFLFRRMIKREFVKLVVSQGKQDLLVGPIDSPYYSAGVSRGLKILLRRVHEWRARYRMKKQAVAMKKIRFWCQLVHRRYKYRAQELLRAQEPFFIYYTQPFENELLDLARRTMVRDPILMHMTECEREEILRKRCMQSSVSVLRRPTQRMMIASTHASNTRDRVEEHDAYKKTELRPLLRLFSRHHTCENHVLISEKKILQDGLNFLQRLNKQHERADEQRALIIQITRLTHEFDKRLLIINKKLLGAAIRQQSSAVQSCRTPSICPVRILRARGHAPTRPERKKMYKLIDKERGKVTLHPATEYERMCVFMPWSIDMYLQMMMSLDRLVLVNGNAGFALSHRQVRQIRAALTIQSAWKMMQCRSKRNVWEILIVRGVICIQRWWRNRIGMLRRMEFLSTAVLLCSTINSNTLFMEEYVYHLLSNPDVWPSVQAVMRPCREHAMRCKVVNGSVEVVLSPNQLLLYSIARQKLTSVRADEDISGEMNHHVDHTIWNKLESACVQRAGYLPVWLPGIPEHRVEDMTSRHEDGTPYLLTDQVNVEPTIMERDLLLGWKEPSSAETSPYVQSFANGRKVANVSAKVMELSQKLSTDRARTLRFAMGAASPSFVRLVFPSVEEARHRALVLLAKTYDPLTRSYAKLYSVETVYSSMLMRHQWAVNQLSGDELEGKRVIDDVKMWLHAEFPSKWSVYMQSKLPIDVGGIQENCEEFMEQHNAITPQVALMSPRRYQANPPPDTNAIEVESNIINRVETRRPRIQAPLHIAEGLIDRDTKSNAAIQPVPVPPSSRRHSDSGGYNRHHLLNDRLGTQLYATLYDKQEAELQEREYNVRQIREERERASEALIVDRRMIQRERAAELAGMEVETAVKLQRLKYEQEIQRIQTKEVIEREHMNLLHRKLTKKFETNFVAQSGAMMRQAARQAVESKLIKREQTRRVTAAEIREREEEALERRQDAKSFWFISNQKTKHEMRSQAATTTATVKAKNENRLKAVRQRVNEDKEIKKMLQLL